MLLPCAPRDACQADSVQLYHKGEPYQILQSIGAYIISSQIYQDFVWRTKQSEAM